jgi:hypothetical protein
MDKGIMETRTFAQQAILEMVERKVKTQDFQDHWARQEESYGDYDDYDDYSDSHGDYYDAT